MRAVGQLAIAAVALCAASCGESRAPLPEPVLFGHGPQYHPPAYGPAVASAKPIGALSCERAPGRTRFLAHVEVIAHGRVALVPSGVGIAPPPVRPGAYV